MIFDINKINENDIKRALNNYDVTISDLIGIGILDDRLNELLGCDVWDIYGFRIKMLAMYKLGIMQGKREERARKGKRII